MAVLDITLDVGQQMLNDSLARYLADTPFPDWSGLSETLGLAGVSIPETDGGFGGDAVEIAIVMAQLGPALAGADWLSHAVATLVISHLLPEHDTLARFANGSLRAAVACPASTGAMPTTRLEGSVWKVSGTAALVAGAADADVIVLADQRAILLLDVGQDGMERRTQMMRDGSVTADLIFDGAAFSGTLLAANDAAFQYADLANDLMLMGRCAEALGLVRRMMDDTSTHMRERRQFGTPIASFQALRHRFADMQLATMTATALTELAVLAMDDRQSDRSRAVGAACAEIHDAVRIVGEGAVQMHGAMGLTEELSLGRQFRRALSIAAGMGPQRAQIERFAAA